MINDNKMKHILGVARKCYNLAKESGYCEYSARRLWLVGYLHDIGYEFTEEPKDHPEIGNEMIKSLFDRDCRAVLWHGKPNHAEDDILDLKILNIADLTVDSSGNDCSVEERLNDIKTRYGEFSRQYTNSVLVAKSCDLIENN